MAAQSIQKTAPQSTAWDNVATVNAKSLIRILQSMRQGWLINDLNHDGTMDYRDLFLAAHSWGGTALPPWSLPSVDANVDPGSGGPGSMYQFQWRITGWAGTPALELAIRAREPEVVDLPGGGVATGRLYFLNSKNLWTEERAIYAFNAPFGQQNLVLPSDRSGVWRLEVILRNPAQGEIVAVDSCQILVSQEPTIQIYLNRTIANTNDPVQAVLAMAGGDIPRAVRIQAVITLPDGTQLSLAGFGPAGEILYSGLSTDAVYPLFHQHLGPLGTGNYMLRSTLVDDQSGQLIGIREQELMVCDTPGWLSGSIYDDLHQPINGSVSLLALVQAVDVDSLAVACSSPVSASGFYRLHPAPGRYFLTAHIIDQEGRHRQGVAGELVRIGCGGFASMTLTTGPAVPMEGFTTGSNGVKKNPLGFETGKEEAAEIRATCATDDLPKPVVHAILSPEFLEDATVHAAFSLFVPLLSRLESEVEFISDHDLSDLLNFLATRASTDSLPVNLATVALASHKEFLLVFGMVREGTSTCITSQILDMKYAEPLQIKECSEIAEAAWDIETLQGLATDLTDDLFSLLRSRQIRPILPELELTLDKNRLLPGQSIQATLVLKEGNGDPAGNEPLSLWHFPVGQSGETLQGQSDASGTWNQFFDVGLQPGPGGVGGAYSRGERIWYAPQRTYRVLDETDLHLSAPAAHLSAGDGETVCIELTEAGSPMAGVAVVVSATGGTIVSASITTDLNGKACFQFTAGDKVGQATVTASYTHLPPGGSSPVVLQSSLEFKVTCPHYDCAGVCNGTARRDCSGVCGGSDQACVDTLPTDRFVRITSDGLPLEGQPVLCDIDGVPPFEFRPMGLSRFGHRSGLVIQFPLGGQIVQESDQQFIQFIEAIAFFGQDFPLQFDTPLKRYNGESRRLPIGPINIQDLIRVFDVLPQEGLPVTLFNRIRLVLNEGRLEQDRIADCLLAYDALDFPLLRPPNGLPQVMLDLSQPDGVCIGLYGEFELPDQSVYSPVLRVSRQNPLWLEIHPDGFCKITGRTEMNFPQGPRLRADLICDDPIYYFHVVADSVQIPLLNSLSDLLPPAPDMGYPTQSATEQLNLAADFQRRLQRAFYHFSAAAVGAATAPEGINGVTTTMSPSGPTPMLTSVLDAWVYSQLARAGESLPLQEVSDLIAQTGDASRGSQDLESIVAYSLALERARQALARLEQGDDPSAALADLETAIAKAEAAALSRAGQNDAINSIASIKNILRSLIEIEAIRQSSGLAAGRLTTEAVPELLKRFMADYLARLGVREEEFATTDNPIIAHMNRFVAYEEMRNLVDLLADAQLLGVDEIPHLPVDECLSQLASRIFATAQAAFDQAESAGDHYALLFALEELVHLASLSQTGLLPEVPALASIHDMDLSRLASRLNSVFNSVLNQPEGWRKLTDRAAELKVMLRIFDEMPKTVRFSPSFIQWIYSKAEAALNESLEVLPYNNNLQELLEILETGNRLDRFSEQFSLPIGLDWRGGQLPRAIAQIQAVALQQNDWFRLAQVLDEMHSESDRFLQNGDTGRRQASLQLITQILMTERAIAVSLWRQHGNGAHIDPLLQGADLLLPGDLYIENAAGSLLYNRLSQFLKGTVMGQLHLPKFDLALTVHTCSFTNGGAFDLTAHGSVKIPQGELSIAPRRPLQVHYCPGSSPSIKGAAQVTLDSGMHFAGFWSLDDPRYAIGLEARDLQIDLANRIVLVVPVFPEGQQLSSEVLIAFNELYTSLGASWDALAPISQPVQLGDVGDIPEYEAAEVTMEFSALEAWSNAVIANASQGISRNYEATLSTLRANLLTLASGAAELQAAVQDSEFTLRRNIVLKKVAEALRQASASERNEVRPDLLTALDQAEQATIDLLQNEKSFTDLERARQSARAALEIAAARDRLDLSSRILEENHLAHFFENVREEQFHQWGLNPTTGQIENEGKFNSLSRKEVGLAMQDYADIVASSQMIGGEMPIDETAMQNLAMRNRSLLLQEYRGIPENDPDARDGILSQCLEIVTLAEQGLFQYPRMVEQLDGSMGPSTSALDDIQQLILPEITRNSQYRIEHIVEIRQRRAQQLYRSLGITPGQESASESLDRDDFDLFRFLNTVEKYARQRFSEQFQETVDREMDYLLQRLENFANRPWTADRLHDGIEALDGILELAQWAERYDHQPQLDRINQVVIPNLTLQFNQAAEAQKAWWMLNRYVELLMEAAQKKIGGVESSLKDACEIAATSSTRSSRRIADALQAYVEDVESATFAVPLPGDLKIHRIHGAIAYNRQTQYMSGTFGGRLELPEIDGFLEIHSATIDNENHFNIQASSTSPLPFDGVRIGIDDLTVSYTDALSFSGQGTLFLPDGAQLGVGVSYEESADSFAFETFAENWALAPGLTLRRAGGLPLVRVAKTDHRYHGAFNARLELSGSHFITLRGGVDEDSFLLTAQGPIEFNNFAALNSIGSLSLSWVRLEYGDHDPADGVINHGLSVSGQGTFTFQGEGSQPTTLGVRLVYRNNTLGIEISAEDLRLELPGGIVIEIEEGSLSATDHFEGEFTRGRVVYVPGLPADAAGNNADIQIAYLSFNTATQQLHLDCASIAGATQAGTLYLPGQIRMNLARLVLNNGGQIPPGAPEPPDGLVVVPGGLALFGQGGIALDGGGLFAAGTNFKGTLSLNSQGRVAIDAGVSGQDLPMPGLGMSLRDARIGIVFDTGSEAFSLSLSGILIAESMVLTVPSESPLYIQMRGTEILSASGTALVSFQGTDIGLSLSWQPGSGWSMRSSLGEIHFGNGVRVYRLNSEPILVLDSQHGEFALRGGVAIPSQENGIGSRLEVAGRLKLSLGGEVQEFTAEGTSENPENWTLPGNIQLHEIRVALGLRNGRFFTHLGGMIVLDQESTFDLQSDLVLNGNDPTDIGLDAQLAVTNIDLFNQAYLFASSIRLQVATQPALSGTLTISGAAGFFPKPDWQLPRGTEDYFLSVANMQSTFQFSPNGFDLQFSNGQLRLPDFFETGNCESGGSGPSISLNPANPLTLSVLNRQIGFRGAFSFANLGFEIPGYEGLEVALCSATLNISGSGLPKLTNVSGTLRVPLPQGDPLDLVLSGKTWSLDGFPEASIGLERNIPLFEQSGFKVTLVGEGAPSCGPLEIRLSRDQGSKIQFSGGIRLSLPTDVLFAEGEDAPKDEEGRIYGEACGAIEITASLPPSAEVRLDSLTIGCQRLHLGGEGGLLVQDATLALSGIPYLFEQSPAHPFVIQISGTAGFEDGILFGLDRAQFEFAGEDFPIFRLAGLNFQMGDQVNLIEGLPLSITYLGLEFSNDPFPEMLLPRNTTLILSGTIEIPPASELQLQGGVDRLRVRINPEGFPEIDPAQLQGLELGVDRLPLGPLNVTGSVFFGTSPLYEWYFGGSLGGKWNGAGVVVTTAFSSVGPIGACLDVGAGPAGIPLGPSGFLLTGVEGGISFSNVVTGDPCDFKAQLGIGDDGRPLEAQASRIRALNQELKPAAAAITWAQLREANRLYEIEQEAARSEAMRDLLETQAVESENDSMCPDFECPPTTVGILCQPHPDLEKYPERVIFKFSSFDQEFLEGLGITESAFSGINDATEAANTFWNLAGEPLGEMFPFAAGELEILGEAFVSALIAAVENIHPASTVYEAVVDAAAAGVPCQTVTMKLTGTFSHAAVSTFLSATGGFVTSTAGSLGAVGSANLVGIPVGHLDGFFLISDASGNPNPSLCGKMDTKLGPLELGEMRLSYTCDGCITGQMEAVAGLGSCLGQETIDLVMSKVRPEFVGLQPGDVLALLNDPNEAATFASGFLAQLFTLDPEDMEGVGDCVAQAMITSLDSLNPDFLFCGTVQPKIFGLPMGGKVSSVYIHSNRHELAGSLGFSPSYMLMNGWLCLGSGGTLCQGIFPAMDEASLGFRLGIPDARQMMKAGLDGQFHSPEDLALFAEDGFGHFLSESTFTIGYEIAPFGLKFADAEARIVMPNLADHPSCRAWVRPEERGLPSRSKLVNSALERNLLADIGWRGDENDLNEAFPEGSDRDRVQGMSFQKDYFPHGGIIGAAKVSLPSVIIQAPSPEFWTLISPACDPACKWETLSKGEFKIISDYFLGMSRVGAMSFYIPAPNLPPAACQMLNASDKMAAIQAFNIDNLNDLNLYPGDLVFFQGSIQGQLLGVPITRAEAVLEPPNMRISAEIPENSWLSGFVSSASLNFEITRDTAPEMTVDEVFRALQADLRRGGIDPAEALNQFTTALNDQMPKVELEAAIQDLHTPPEIQNLVDMSLNAALYGYSPRYYPDLGGNIDNPGPVLLVQRYGGLAFQGSGDMRFGKVGDNDYLMAFEVTNAELGVVPASLTLAGQLEVPEANIGMLTMRDLFLSFNTSPAVNDPFLLAEGGIEPFEIGFLELSPLAENATLIGATFEIFKKNTGIGGLFKIDPAQIEMDLFVVDTEIRIHGTTEEDPFTFSTEGPWNATVSIPSGVMLMELVQFTSSTPLIATASGVGLNSLELSASIPSEVTITTFPEFESGSPLRKEFVMGDSGCDPWQLTAGSDGTFLIDGCLPPMDLGIFRLSGSENKDAFIEASLSNEGIEIPSGAKLWITGLSQDAFTLNQFDIRTDGSMNVEAQTGDFTIRDQAGKPVLACSTASLELIRTATGYTRLIVKAPESTLFPNTDFENSFSEKAYFEIDSDGVFTWNLGRNTLNLNPLLVVEGEIEIGNRVPSPPVLNVAIDPIDFGTLEKGEKGEASIRIANAGAVPFIVMATSSNPSVFPISFASYSIPRGQSVDLGVRFMASKAGEFTGEITISGRALTDRDWPLKTSVHLEGIGVGIPSISVVPSSNVDFGQQPLYSSASRWLSITNQGTGPLMITGIDVPRPFSVGVSNLTLAIDESRQIEILYTPDALGKQTQVLTIQSNDPDHSPIQIALNGEGIMPEWYELKDGGDTLRAVSVVLDKNGKTKSWTVGDYGTVLYSDNGGRAWAERELPSGFHLRDVLFWNYGVNGCIVGDYGMIYSTNDSGVTWTGRGPGKPSLQSIRSTTSSISWRGAALSGAGEIFAAGSGGRIFRGSSGKSDAWCVEDLNAVDFEGNIGIAVGNHGTILRSVDGGGSWAIVSQSRPENYYDVDLGPGIVGLIAGATGEILRSSDGAAGIWAPVNSNTRETLRRVQISGSQAYASGDQGVFLTSADAGVNWRSERTGIPNPINGFSVLGGSIWTAGRYGRMEYRPMPLPGTPRPLLTYDPLELDFGAAGLGATVQKRAVITNQGTSAIDISDIRISEGADRGFRISGPTGFTGIQPGESRSFEIVFEPGVYTDGVTGKAAFNTTDTACPSAEIRLSGSCPAPAWVEWEPLPYEPGILALQFPSSQVGYALSASRIFKTTNGGDSWDIVRDAIAMDLNFTFSAMSFMNTTTGWVAGGGLTGYPNPNHTIFYTTNGGQSWSAQESPLSARILDIFMASVPVSGKPRTMGLAVTNSDILTYEGTGPWALFAPEPSGYSNGRIAFLRLDPLEGNQYDVIEMVGAGGSLYSYNSTSGAWTTLFSTPLVTANDLSARYDNGWYLWVVGTESTLARKTPAGSWTFGASGLPTGANLSSVSFASSSTGWVVARGPSVDSARILHSTDRGANWSTQLTDSIGSIRCVYAVSSDLAYAGGDSGRFWKFGSIADTPRGRVNMPGVVDLGVTTPNSELVQTLEIGNIGVASLNIKDIRIEGNAWDAPFELDATLPVSIAPGGSQRFDLRFKSAQEGFHDARLILLCDGEERIVKSVLRATVSEGMPAYTVTTEPQGLKFTIDGDPVEYTAPHVFLWSRGSQHTIRVQETQQVGGGDLSYVFSHWSDGVSAASTVFLAEDSQTLVARFSPRHFSASPPDSPDSPDNRPGGLYVWVKEATLELPNLEGPDGAFEVQGGMLISLDHIQASLKTKAIRIPEATDQLAFLEASSGSWFFDYQNLNNLAQVRLIAESPGVKVLGKSAAPETALDIYLDSGGKFAVSFDAYDDLVLLPGIFEIGQPDSGEPVHFSVNNRDSLIQMEADGQVRLFKLPGMDGWAYEDDTRFAFEIGNLDWRTPALETWLCIPDNGSIIKAEHGYFWVSLSSESGLGFGARELDLSLLGNSWNDIEADLNDGKIRFRVNPESDLKLGPFSIDVLEGNPVSMEWNLRSGELQLEIPRFEVDSPLSSPGNWPEMTFPGISLDTSGDFRKCIPLPSVDFRGMALGEHGNDDDVNYVLFERRDGHLHLKAHDEMDFYLSEMEIWFELTEHGNASDIAGGFAGEVKISDLVSLGSLDLEYDGNRPDYQFRGKTSIGPSRWGVYFGTSGVKACTPP